MVDNAFVDVLNDPSWRNEGRFFGKYRAIVSDNKDPNKLGRILPIVPAISGMTQNWANPCAPYAGKDVGFYAIPPVGAKVWIEFEGGNPNFPIWSGCFWQDGEVPTEVGTNTDDPSQVKVFKTRVATFWIDDTDQKGQVVLQFNDSTVDDPVTVKLHLDSTGLQISVAGSEDTSTITQKPDDISTVSKTLNTKSTEDTTVTAEKSLTATITEDMTLDASGNATIKAASDMSLEATNISAKASTGLTLEGSSTASLKGGTSVKVEGAAANFEASGTNTIKGAMVKIN